MPAYYYLNIPLVAFVALAFLLRRRPRALADAAYVMLALGVAAFAFICFGPIWHHHGVDFAQYYLGAAELFAGRDPYLDRVVYAATGGGPLLDAAVRLGLPAIPTTTYPPVFYVAVMPLLAFPYETAFFVWAALNVGFLWAAFFLTAHALAITNKTALAAAAAILLVSYPAYDNVYHGQANALVALLVAAALWAWLRGKRLSTGAFVAAATLIKIFPGLALLYFIIRRRWRELAAAAAVLAAAIVACALIWGPALWLHYGQYVVFNHLRWPNLETANVAPTTILARFATTDAAALTLVAVAKLINVGLLVAGVVYFARRRWDPSREFAFVVAASLALTANVGPAYLVVLLIPFMYLGREIFAGRAGPAATALAVTSLIILAAHVDFTPLVDLTLRRRHLSQFPATLLLIPKPLALALLAASFFFLPRKKAAAAKKS